MLNKTICEKAADLSFNELRQNPGAYKGNSSSYGAIIETRLTEEGSDRSDARSDRSLRLLP
jgi:hypothetical protein